MQVRTKRGHKLFLACMQLPLTSQRVMNLEIYLTGQQVTRICSQARGMGIVVALTLTRRLASDNAE